MTDEKSSIANERVAYLDRACHCFDAKAIMSSLELGLCTQLPDALCEKLLWCVLYTYINYKDPSANTWTVHLIEVFIELHRIRRKRSAEVDEELVCHMLSQLIDLMSLRHLYSLRLSSQFSNHAELLTTKIRQVVGTDIRSPKDKLNHLRRQLSYTIDSLSRYLQISNLPPEPDMSPFNQELKMYMENLRSSWDRPSKLESPRSEQETPRHSRRHSVSTSVISQGSRRSSVSSNSSEAGATLRELTQACDSTFSPKSSSYTSSPRFACTMSPKSSPKLSSISLTDVQNDVFSNQPILDSTALMHWLNRCKFFGVVLGDGDKESDDDSIYCSAMYSDCFEPMSTGSKRMQTYDSGELESSLSEENFSSLYDASAFPSSSTVLLKSRKRLKHTHSGSDSDRKIECRFPSVLTPDQRSTNSVVGGKNTARLRSYSPLTADGLSLLLQLDSAPRSTVHPHSSASTKSSEPLRHNANNKVNTGLRPLRGGVVKEEPTSTINTSPTPSINDRRSRNCSRNKSSSNRRRVSRTSSSSASSASSASSQNSRKGKEATVDSQNRRGHDLTCNHCHKVRGISKQKGRSSYRHWCAKINAVLTAKLGHKSGRCPEPDCVSCYVTVTI